MQTPFFYESHLGNDATLTLGEDTSKHVVQVLRMKEGDEIRLTDGKGLLAKARIVNAHKKSTSVEILERELIPAPRRSNHIAISFVKNNSRFEWFLEKATEIGVSTITPLLCKRTEKSHFRQDRLQAILVSALLQSQQAWLPELMPPTPFEQLIAHSGEAEGKWIAHCLETNKQDLQDLHASLPNNNIILIGPEGDFTSEEINNAIEQNYSPVSLGPTRLRTETAGIVAAVLLQ